MMTTKTLIFLLCKLLGFVLHPVVLKGARYQPMLVTNLTYYTITPANYLYILPISPISFQ